MSEYFEEQLNKLIVYQQLKCKCENNNHHEVLALVAEVGTFAVERLKTVIKICRSLLCMMIRIF